VSGSLQLEKEQDDIGLFATRGKVWFELRQHPWDLDEELGEI
jgi:hypothetical protein